VVQSGVDDPVAVGARDAGDQAVGAEAAQVIAHLPGGDLGLAEQVSEQAAQVAVAESVRAQPERQQRLQQGVGAGLAQAQPAMGCPVSLTIASCTAAKASAAPIGPRRRNPGSARPRG
jgi:hypothetical protein